MTETPTQAPSRIPAGLALGQAVGQAELVLTRLLSGALAEAGNKHAEVDELPGLNHLFQTAKTGSPAEYAQIEETMSPIALEKIGTWILKQ